MKEQLEAIRAGALAAIGAAGNTGELEALRVQYLGKKGALTSILRSLGDVAAEERPKIGKMVNEVRAKMEQRINEQMKLLETHQMEEKLASETLDFTLPGRKPALGHLHPVTQTLRDIKKVFMRMGFKWWKARKSKRTISTLKP